MENATEENKIHEGVIVINNPRSFKVLRRFAVLIILTVVALLGGGIIIIISGFVRPLLTGAVLDMDILATGVLGFLMFGLGITFPFFQYKITLRQNDMIIESWYSVWLRLKRSCVFPYNKIDSIKWDLVPLWYGDFSSMQISSGKRKKSIGIGLLIMVNKQEADLLQQTLRAKVASHITREAR